MRARELYAYVLDPRNAYRANRAGGMTRPAAAALVPGTMANWLVFAWLVVEGARR